MEARKFRVSVLFRDSVIQTLTRRARELRFAGAVQRVRVLAGRGGIGADEESHGQGDQASGGQGAVLLPVRRVFAQDGGHQWGRGAARGAGGHRGVKIRVSRGVGGVLAMLGKWGCLPTSGSG